MRKSNSEEPGIETIAAALIYLMSHYARTGCPGVAVCVARHMQCLSVHPDAGPVLRDTCASLHGSWCQMARPANNPVH